MAADRGSAIEVATDDTAIRVEDVKDRLAITSFKAPADQVDWIGGAKEALPIPFIQKLRIGDREMAIDWKFAGSGTTPGRPGRDVDAIQIRPAAAGTGFHLDRGGGPWSYRA